MTTQIKSSKLSIVVMAPSAPDAAAGSTSKLTNGVAVRPSLAELTRCLVSQPSDQAALSAVCAALRNRADVEELVELLELWSNANQGDGLPDYAMANVAFRIAQESTGTHARELCRTALDLCPVHVAALSLFEELADASWTDELCARYQIFLEDAPLHDVSPAICETVTNKLVESERAARAFAHYVSPEWQSTEALSMQA